MNEKICKISLFAFILATVAATPVDAAVKTSNAKRSYAGAYQQVNAMYYQQEYANSQTATTASANATLPVTVDDKELADAILNNTSNTTNISELESCAMIYPNGVFKWAVPESGVRLNPTQQCVAVVELRDANTNAILATTTVAAGDTMKCNIDNFPSSGLNMAALSKVELPADRAPTEEDVKAVLNQEQKQNAGLKIAAGAVVAGIAGNLLAPKEAGDTKLFGTGKTRLIDTAIGATAGAGIMAASTYSGKVAGDTIKSTAVNAESGMIVGNMLAGASGGDSVLATTKCTITEGENKGEHDCIIGYIQEIEDEFDCGGEKICIINGNGTSVWECEEEGNDKLECEQKPIDLTNVEINMGNGTTEKIERGGAKKADVFGKANECYAQTENGFEKHNSGCNASMYFKIKTAYKVGHKTRAYAIFTSGTLNKPLGYKYDDWTDLEKKARLYNRNPDNSVGHQVEADNDKIKFEPSMRDAESGGLIDLSNQARAKGTIVGAAAGGALGGFAGYQGAVDEVSERFVTALREYKDSLSNFVCMTGGRFLSEYNSYVEIPEPTKQEQ